MNPSIWREFQESDCSTVDTGSLHDVPHTPELEPATARLGMEISEEKYTSWFISH